MRTVLKNLVDGLSEAWVRVGSLGSVPCKSSISGARQRIGSGVMSRKFHIVVRPLGTAKTPGVFQVGRSIMAVDPTVFDVPDSEASSVSICERAATGPGTQAHEPKVRLVLLIEAQRESSRLVAGFPDAALSHRDTFNC